MRVDDCLVKMKGERYVCQLHRQRPHMTSCECKVSNQFFNRILCRATVYKHLRSYSGNNQCSSVNISSLLTNFEKICYNHCNRSNHLHVSCITYWDNKPSTLCSCVDQCVTVFSIHYQSLDVWKLRDTSGNERYFDSQSFSQTFFTDSSWLSARNHQKKFVLGMNSASKNNFNVKTKSDTTYTPLLDTLETLDSDNYNFWTISQISTPMYVDINRTDITTENFESRISSQAYIPEHSVEINDSPVEIHLNSKKNMNFENDKINEITKDSILPIDKKITDKTFSDIISDTSAVNSLFTSEKDNNEIKQQSMESSTQQLNLDTKMFTSKLDLDSYDSTKYDLNQDFFLTSTTQPNEIIETESKKQRTFEMQATETPSYFNSISLNDSYFITILCILMLFSFCLFFLLIKYICEYHNKMKMNKKNKKLEI